MRYFLLDRVTEVVPGERACGIKNVTLTDEVLHDHFPDFPVLPGALVIEAAAQLAGFLLEVTTNTDDAVPPRRAVLVQIERAKFSRAAEPGDRIDLEVKLLSSLETAAQITCEAHVGDARVMRGTLTFMLKTVESERVHEQRRYLYKLWTRGMAAPPEIR